MLDFLKIKMTNSIIGPLELEYMVIDYLDPFLDLRNMALLNRYYYYLIDDLPIFKEFKQFFLSGDCKNYNVLHFSVRIKNLDKIETREWLFIKACAFGLLNVARYYEKHVINKLEIFPNAMIQASISNKLNIVKWLADWNIKNRSPNESLPFGFNENNHTLNCSCSRGHTEIVQFLLDHKDKLKPPIRLNYMNYEALQLTIQFGYLEIVKLLCEKDKTVLNTIFSDSTGCRYRATIAFIDSCQYGHLDIAKWFFETGNQLGFPIDMHDQQEAAFRKSCQHGHLEIATWLHDLSNIIGSPIDIHAKDDFSFAWSCANGHLDVAKWLHNLGNEIDSPINIHTHNYILVRYSSRGAMPSRIENFAFRASEKRNHDGVKNWLDSLDTAKCQKK